nr:hypothetical protein [Tanacetum cinerariifolium]
MTAGQRKSEVQWTTDERKAANLDQRLKSLIVSVLSDDQTNFVINCLTAKSTWDDLILYHEGPSNVKESRVMDLKLCFYTFKFKEGENLTQNFTRYKALMNELVNDDINLSKLEINTGFINGLPHKWLSFCQSFRNTNHEKYSELASLFGKFKSEENLIDNSPDDEEDTRSSHEYLNDLEEEYQDDEEVSSDDNEMIEVKVLMALAEDNDAVSKEGARNGFTLPNHNTGRILPPESQRNTTNPLVAIIDSSAIDYDLADESSVCSTPLPLMKKLDVPAKGNKSSSALKVNLAPACKLKSVKIKDDPPLAIAMKELNDLTLQIIKNQSSYSRSEALQAKKSEALKSTRAKSSNANGSKTPTKSDKNNHPTHENDIPNDNPPEHSSHNNDSPIIENIINTEAVQDSEPTSSPVEDASVQNTIPIPNIPSSSIPSTISLVAQDRWSQDKHIELVNILGDPGAGMLT